MNKKEEIDLKAFRKEFGYSQLDMATYLNITAPTYIKIEKGRRTLNYVEKQRIQSLIDGQSTLIPQSFDVKTKKPSYQPESQCNVHTKEVILSDGKYLIVTTTSYIKL